MGKPKTARSITQRPPNGKVKEKEVRVPIKKLTAENALRMNQEVARANEAVNVAAQNLHNHLVPILTERGLEKGRVVHITEKPPYELVVMVPK